MNENETRFNTWYTLCFYDQHITLYRQSISTLYILGNIELHSG